MYIGLHVTCYSCRQILMKLEFSQKIFEKESNITFHEIDRERESISLFMCVCVYIQKKL
jgi:hypothetical protein